MANCGDCVYYFNLTNGDGNCRRYPPLTMTDQGVTGCHCPIVQIDGWCGECSTSTTGQNGGNGA